MPPTPTQLLGVSVLAAEDQPDALELLRRLLEAHGAAVTCAASGSDALAAFERARPSVLLFDIGLPGMDGYQLLQEVRRIEESRGWAHTPAMALTAFGSLPDILTAGRAGFQRHLTKPFVAELLVRNLAELAGVSVPSSGRKSRS